jgi:hypothetical protein
MVHLVSGIAVADAKYYDLTALLFLSFKHSVVRSFGWQSEQDSLLLTSLLAPSAVIRTEGLPPFLEEVSREWGRIASLLGSKAAESAVCVRFAGVTKRSLYGALFDPAPSISYRGVEIGSHLSCGSCREEGSQCWAKTGNAETLADVFSEGIIKPVSMLVQFALARRFPMIVDVEDTAKKTGAKRNGTPIL